MVNRMGNRRTRKPPNHPIETLPRARHSSRTRSPSHRTRHRKTPLPPSRNQRNPASPYGHPPPSPAHEPPRRQTFRLRHSGGIQDSSERVVARQQPRPMEVAGGV